MEFQIEIAFLTELLEIKIVSEQMLLLRKSQILNHLP
jgi:hypothetical protein